MKIKLFGTKGGIDLDKEEEAYIEVNTMDSEERRGKIGIRVEKLNDFSDTDRILRSIRNGNVIFVKIKGLKEKDIGELKRAVEKLKKSVTANNGDIAGVEQEWLIITPEYASVERD